MICRQAVASLNVKRSYAWHFALVGYFGANDEDVENRGRYVTSSAVSLITITVYFVVARAFISGTPW